MSAREQINFVFFCGFYALFGAKAGFDTPLLYIAKKQVRSVMPYRFAAPSVLFPLQNQKEIPAHTRGDKLIRYRMLRTK